MYPSPRDLFNTSMFIYSNTTRMSDAWMRKINYIPKNCLHMSATIDSKFCSRYLLIVKTWRLYWLSLCAWNVIGLGLLWFQAAVKRRNQPWAFHCSRSLQEKKQSLFLEREKNLFFSKQRLAGKKDNRTSY